MGSTGTSKARPNTVLTGGGVNPPQVTPLTTYVNNPVNQNNPAVQSQAPSASNTPVVPGAVSALTQMSDSELASLFNASKRAVMPNYLADRNDATQKFVFQAGINGKPMVLDQAAFNQYLKDNNIPKGEILARSVNGISYTNQQGYTTKLTADQVQDILKYSRLTYIGGKHGGQMLGAGAYFAMTGGSGTNYGGTTAQAVLNPSTARVINQSNLQRMAQAFDRSHPQFAKATGGYKSSNQSVYALVLGYNVITDHRAGNTRSKSGDYYNVIDRSALVYLK